MEEFAAWGVKTKSWQVSTVANYLSGIKNRFSSLNISVDFSDAYRTLKGFSRLENIALGEAVVGGVAHSQKGASPFPLGALAEAWKLGRTSVHNQTHFEACLVGFWLMLRRNEYLGSSSARKPPLVAGCVRFYRGGLRIDAAFGRDADVVGVIIRDGKHKHGQHVEVKFPSLPDKNFCLVSLLHRRVVGMLATDLVPLYLFLISGDVMSRCMGKLSPPPVDFSLGLHSLRKGAASAFLRYNLDISILKMHGRWGQRDMVSTYGQFPSLKLDEAAKRICGEIVSLLASP